MKNKWITLFTGALMLPYSFSYATNTAWSTTGNIGIGTVSPQAPLHLQSSADYMPQVLIESIAGNGAGYLILQKTKAAFVPGDVLGLILANSITSGAAQQSAYLCFIVDSPSVGTNVQSAMSFVSRNNDNTVTEKLRFSSNGNVGIGTQTPTTALDVSSFATSGNGPFLTLENKSGANAGTFGPGVLLNNHVAGTHGYILQERQDAHSFFSIANITSPYTDYFVIAQSGNIGIGTTTPNYPLSVNGTIQAKEVIVETTGWSDYVFADNYKLTPLAEVEQQIKVQKHLSGIPSAEEVLAKGISIGSMQAKLLAKIEELTLHQIEQEKRISAQQDKMGLLESRNASLEKRVSILSQKDSSSGAD